MHSRQSRLHQLRRIRLTQALLSRSQGPVIQYSIFNHHGPAWMEGQGRPATRPRSRRCDKVHQQICQRARNHFRQIPPHLERCACMPQVLPAENRGPALLHQHQDGRTSTPPRPPTLLLHLRRSRSRPDCVPHPPEARRLLHLASRQRHPEPAPSPTSTHGPCPNYDCTSHSAQSRNFPPLMSGRSQTSTSLPVASPTSAAHNRTWTPIPTPI